LAGLLALASCGGGDAAEPTSACGSGKPHITLGTGEEGFVAIEPGAALSMICGPQGGRHVTLRFRATGVGDSFTYAATLVDAATGTEIAASMDAGNAIPFTVEADGCESDDLRVVFHVPTAEVSGRKARLHAQLQDGSGRSAQAEIEVVIDTSMATCPG